MEIKSEISYFINNIDNNSRLHQLNKRDKLIKLKKDITNIMQIGSNAMFNICSDEDLDGTLYNAINTDFVALQRKYLREIDEAIINI